MTHHEQWNGSLAAPPPFPGDYIEFLEGQIERRASGQIRDLHVQFKDDQIVIQGRSRTYHAKQLAHQAVLDLAHGAHVLANQIEVC